MSLMATVENGRLTMHNLIPSLPECKPVGQSGPENGDIAEVPVGLDPEHHRIILAHWFGWHPVSAVAVAGGHDSAPAPIHEAHR